MKLLIEYIVNCIHLVVENFFNPEYFLIMRYLISKYVGSGSEIFYASIKPKWANYYSDLHLSSELILIENEKRERYGYSIQI